jgi:glucokinase
LDPRRATGGGLGFPGETARAVAVLDRDNRGIRRDANPRLLNSAPFRTIETRGFALSAQHVIAVDLGGTRIRAAVIQPDGSRLARIDRPTPKDQGPAAVVAACIDAARDSRAAASTAAGGDIAGIGVSSPGPVNPRTGVVVETPNIGPMFKDIPLTAALGEALDLPAFLDRDTNVAALGERAFGAARDCDDFIYLTVSTGVGGSIVTGGEILHGPDGLAGELGHIPVTLDGPRCGCGGIGHVEAYASGAGLAKLAQAAVEDGRSPFLAERATAVGGAAKLSAVEVADGEDAGDPVCVELMTRARRAIAVGCVGYVHAFNPHRIVIGGSIAEAQGERLLGEVRETLRTEAFKAFSRHVTVVPAGLGGDVSLAGAHPLVMARLAARDRQSISNPTRSDRPVAVPGGTHA